MEEEPKLQPSFTSAQLTAAIAAGLELSNPESDAVISVKFAGGVLILREILLSMASGKLGIVPISLTATEGPKADSEEEEKEEEEKEEEDD
jgi:hypothetical protein